MSIQLIEAQIRRFLATSEPEVLCISGHWGVGKTYAWNRYLKDAAEKDGIALKRYSYVSLFGVNSLEELKYSIFENSVKSSDIGVELTLEALRSDTTAASERFIRKALRVFQNTPVTGNYLAALGPIWSSSVKDTVICIDDIERRGEDLSPREVLGLVSTLKDQKKCKVALVLNDEALERDKAEFLKYYEKVVDISLKFAPSPVECVRIALAGNTLLEKLLTEDCVVLGISNIRLIKRIERIVKQIEPMLRGFDEGVLKQAIHSLALLGWVIYAPGIAPSLEYIQRRSTGADILKPDKDKPLPKEEAAWNALLDSYVFGGMDEFDLVLLDGVRDGFFDPASVQKRGSNLNEEIRAATAGKGFLNTWEMYHDSFDDNQEEVLDAMYQSAMEATARINLVNLSSTVGLFKELGRPQQAAEILKHYISIHGKDRELFNLRNYPFASDVRDPDVVQAFSAKFATFKDTRDPKGILLSMANTNSWGPDDITFLSTLPVEDYYHIFKNSKGFDLRRIISACLQFDRITNATPDMTVISKRAKDALQRIGQESAINARRVATYGVVINAGPEV
jgi:hypothetical protein